MDAELEYHGKSLAAPVIFLIVTAFELLSRFLERYKKEKSRNAMDVQLRAEIKQLLMEAASLSGPSTFAQAAKLRRAATAKEKELAKNQELHKKEMEVSYDTYERVLMIIKVLTCFVLIVWFWRIPVAAISEQLLQPFGKVLSWTAGGSVDGNVMVGVIPWMLVSSRVSKFLCKKVIK